VSASTKCRTNKRSKSKSKSKKNHAQHDATPPMRCASRSTDQSESIYGGVSSNSSNQSRFRRILRRLLPVNYRTIKNTTERPSSLLGESAAPGGSTTTIGSIQGFSYADSKMGYQRQPSPASRAFRCSDAGSGKLILNIDTPRSLARDEKRRLNEILLSTTATEQCENESMTSSSRCSGHENNFTMMTHPRRYASEPNLLCDIDAPAALPPPPRPKSMATNSPSGTRTTIWKRISTVLNLNSQSKNPRSSYNLVDLPACAKPVRSPNFFR